MPCHHDPRSVLAVHAGQVVQEPGQLLRAERGPALSGLCQLLTASPKGVRRPTHWHVHCPGLTC